MEMAVGGGGRMVVVMGEHLVGAVVMELHLGQEVMELHPVLQVTEPLEAIPSHLFHPGPLQVLQGEVWGGPRIWEAV